MFPDLITPVSDFEHQLGACFNAMSQDDAIGQILVVERMSGMLHMRHIASADLMDTDVDDYEMVIFDGGNTSGTRGSMCSSASARALLRVPSLTSSPFRGLFSYAARNAGMLRCRFLRAGRPPWAMLFCPMSVGAADMPRQSRPSRAASTGNRAGRFFLRTYRVHPRHHKGPLPCGRGIPVFPRGVSPWTVPHQIHDAFAGRRPCAP